ncbi:hypothetical protein D3C80_526240 [compost metagenome]
MHPAFAMMGVEEARQDGTGDAGQNSALALDNNDLGAERPRGRRRLEPDIAAADDDQSLHAVTLRRQRRLQRLGVGGGAQGHDAAQISAFDRQQTRPRAGGQDQIVIGNRVAVIQAHRPRGPVDGRDCL